MLHVYSPFTGYFTILHWECNCIGCIFCSSFVVVVVVIVRLPPSLTSIILSHVCMYINRCLVTESLAMRAMYMLNSYSDSISRLDDGWYFAKNMYRFLHSHSRPCIQHTYTTKLQTKDENLRSSYQLCLQSCSFCIVCLLWLFFSYIVRCAYALARECVCVCADAVDWSIVIAFHI